MQDFNGKYNKKLTMTSALQSEIMTDYPSQYITRQPERTHSLDPYTLTELDMKNIFEELQAYLEGNFQETEDGARCECECKMFHIEAVHHYEAHAERGGDNYCGIWEMVGITDVDRFKVDIVIDEDGRQYPELVEKLNQYAKNNQ